MRANPCSTTYLKWAALAAGTARQERYRASRRPRLRAGEPLLAHLISTAGSGICIELKGAIMKRLALLLIVPCALGIFVWSLQPMAGEPKSKSPGKSETNAKPQEADV